VPDTRPTATAPVVPHGRGGGVFPGWRIVAALAISQTVGYGVLSYAFGVILGPMRTDLGLSIPVASGAVTLSLLVCAAASIPVGRWLDRHGGRALMTAGSLAATLLVAGWSQVSSTLELYAVFAGIGVASAMVLYEPAFAVVVTWFHAGRSTALLAITVVAGFASTIFMPLTGYLTAAHGWRSAVLTLAIIHGLVTIPLHLTLRRPTDGATRPPPAKAPTTRDTRAAILHTAYRDPFFWTMGLALVAHALTTTVLAVHLVGYLIDLGHPAAFAATITGLLGVLSVTGRLITTAISRRASLTTIAALIFTIQAAAAFAMPSAGHSETGAIMCVLGLGLGFGVVSIIKPALIAAQYGTTAYGTLSGVIAVPVTLAKAAGPFAAALLLTATGSYPWMITTVGIALLASAAATFTSGRHYRPEPVTPAATDTGAKNDMSGTASAAKPGSL
jgi:MFS family permease